MVKYVRVLGETLSKDLEEPCMNAKALLDSTSQVFKCPSTDLLSKTERV
jgi:hypothetical protein